MNQEIWPRALAVLIVRYLCIEPLVSGFVPPGSLGLEQTGWSILR